MNAISSPLVSVIMPVYNGAAFIREAIRSVLKQSYSNIELLIVNDGSNDNTEEVVLDVTGVDSRVKYVKQERKGAAAARNVALRNMNGAFFCFLDADDTLPEDAIQARMNKFASDPALDFCDGAVTIFDGNMKYATGHWMPAYSGYVFRQLIRLSPSCFFGLTWLIKRNYCISYEFQEKMTHAEDLFFYIEISRSGKYDFIKQTILNYRTSPNSAMRDLKGLANGYRTLYEMVLLRFPSDIPFTGKLYLWFKIRKIMVLSFLSTGKIGDAFYFLITGTVK